MYFIQVKNHPILTMQPCKTLFINTPKIWKMYKGIGKRENVHRMSSQLKLNVEISPCQKKTGLNNFEHIEKIIKLFIRVSIKVLIIYKRAEPCSHDELKQKHVDEVEREVCVVSVITSPPPPIMQPNLAKLISG